MDRKRYHDRQSPSGYQCSPGKDILTDYDRVTASFPTMKELKILQDDGVVKTMAQQVKPLPPSLRAYAAGTEYDAG